MRMILHPVLVPHYQQTPQRNPPRPDTTQWSRLRFFQLRRHCRNIWFRSTLAGGQALAERSMVLKTRPSASSLKNSASPPQEMSGWLSRICCNQVVPDRGAPPTKNNCRSENCAISAWRSAQHAKTLAPVIYRNDYNIQRISQMFIFK